MSQVRETYIWTTEFNKNGLGQVLWNISTDSLRGSFVGPSVKMFLKTNDILVLLSKYVRIYLTILD